MKIRFKMNYPTSDKAQPVFMLLTCGKKSPIKIVVKDIRLHPNQWNKNTERVRDLKELKNRHEINKLLNEMQGTAQKVVDDILRQNPPLTCEKVNEKIRAIYPSLRTAKQPLTAEPQNETEIVPKLTFWQFAEKYLKDLSTKVHENGKLTNKQTIKNYKTAINCLKDFEVKIGKTIDFPSFDVAFITAYKTYLTIDKQHKINTIDKKIGALNRLLDIAHDNDLHENTAYKTRKEFTTKRENVDNVFLTENELTMIENHDFSQNERLEHVRDWFLIACWTGLRFSDLHNLKQEQIENNKITIEQQKTGQKVAISLDVTDTIPKILAKRNGAFPILISNQKFNKNVKEVLKIVGINTATTIYETIGGKRIGTTKEKYEFVSAHTARRTFATNLYLRDVPISRIMAATGHTTEKEFTKYIKATQIEKQGNLKDYMK